MDNEAGMDDKAGIDDEAAMDDKAGIDDEAGMDDEDGMDDDTGMDGEECGRSTSAGQCIKCLCFPCLVLFFIALTIFQYTHYCSILLTTAQTPLVRSLAVIGTDQSQAENIPPHSLSLCSLTIRPKDNWNF